MLDPWLLRMKEQEKTEEQDLGSGPELMLILRQIEQDLDRSVLDAVIKEFVSEKPPKKALVDMQWAPAGMVGKVNWRRFVQHDL